MKEEFLKINPYHTMPTLEFADGTGLWESNSILRYLALKYKLSQFPTDLQDMARVSQAMDYRQTILYPAISKVAYFYLGFSQTKPSEDDEKNLAKELERFATIYLKDGKFVGGFSSPTLADFCIATAFCFLEGKKGREFPKAVEAYVERFTKAVPEYKGIRAKLDGYIKHVCHAKQ